MDPSKSPEPIIGQLTANDMICFALFIGTLLLIMAALAWNIKRRNKGGNAGGSTWN